MITQPRTNETLQFADCASCQRWIETLPLTNAPLAQQTLLRQVTLLVEARLPSLELLKILEVLRAPVADVQHELARKYAGKALPLEAAELAAWEKAVTLWDTMAEGYFACRNAQVQGDSALRTHGALIVMRCLGLTAEAMFEHYRTHRQPSSAYWRKLHELYVFAEQSGYAQTMIADVFNRRAADSSCAAVYCRALLLQLANPFALTPRQLDFVAHWLNTWAGLVGLSLQPLPPSSIPSLAVDLASGNGGLLAQEFKSPAGLRYLDLEHLGRTLRQLITLLKQGQTPGQLGLGEDARQPGCENLLMLLYIQWCRAGAGRQEPRHAGEEKTQVCIGIHPAHFYITGRAFRAPGSNLTRQEEHDMQLFGHISERTQHMLASGNSSIFESWEIINHSHAGFMCMLRQQDAEIRIHHNQLVAVRPSSQPRFQLGIVQWLRVEESNELFVGVRLFPGVVQGAAARPLNFNPTGVKGFERALLIPESPGTAATLVLPSGWYQAGRFVEIYTDKKWVVKLTGLLEKGSDFERCTITLN
jgi:hypothetical protein